MLQNKPLFQVKRSCFTATNYAIPWHPMARYVFPILFVVVLILPFALRLAVGGTAEAEGQTTARLTIVTPHNGDIKQQYEAAFRAWHTEKYGYAVDLDFRNIGGTNDIVKALTTFYAPYVITEQGPDGKEIRRMPPPEAIASAPYNLVWGGGDFVFNIELEGGAKALQAVDLSQDTLRAAFPEPELAGIALYDQDDDGIHWVGVCLSSFGIVYSPDYYNRLGLSSPEVWADLGRPELAGRVVLADPAKSGSAAVAYMMILQRAMADAEEAFFEAGNTKETNGLRGGSRPRLAAGHGRLAAHRCQREVLHGQRVGGACRGQPCQRRRRDGDRLLRPR